MADNNKQNAPAGYVTISEAIRLSGVARSTFYEHIKDGKISVSSLNFRGKDKKFVQVVDLLAVFGQLSNSEQEKQARTEIEQQRAEIEQKRTEIETAVELGRAQARIEGLERLVEELREAKETAERDKENLSKLLSESIATVKLLESKEEAKPGKSPGFFARLFGRD